MVLGLGNPRGFENPFLLAFGVIWFRWHNYIAMDLGSKHPDWDDERLFEEARRRVIAHHQVCVTPYCVCIALHQLCVAHDRVCIAHYQVCVAHYRVCIAHHQVCV